MPGIRRPRLILAAADAAAWAIALPLATWLRFELDWSQLYANALSQVIVIAVLAQWAAGSVKRMYSGRYWPGSLDEAVHLGSSVLLAGVVLLAVNALPGLPPTPRSVPLIAMLLALVLCLTLRLAIRLHQERVVGRGHTGAQRVVVFGAGGSGQHLVRAILADPACGYVPVGFLDDDPGKRNLRVCGIAVLGTSHDIADLVIDTKADLVVITTDAADTALLHQVASVAAELGVMVKTVPPLGELFQPREHSIDLRDLDVADLLGREQVDLGLGGIGRFLAHKRVLVTGAGGSIGSELCRQIHRYGPAELFMLDRDESALHAVRLSIYGNAMLDSPDVILADIRDREALAEVFDRCSPTVVFHAAALKHLPMLEQYPMEAWKTNVLGTLNVLEAARTAGVATFVNISTDKASNPISVLGCSKRVGERLVASAGSAGAFLSVRFGNVLGSRGSVLSTFVDQVANGRRVTVTHPEVTRFFMTIPEAVHLVLQAAVIGHSGEALLLDMGKPVRIVDLARQLMRLAGRPGEIVFTGLRAGEKLHEELFGFGEHGERTEHPAISRITVPPLDLGELDWLVRQKGEVSAMTECLRDQRPAMAPAGEWTA
ncbi:MAG: nucleoside-diphosphate sugar epimerase/dehydratase [Kibdelosporangium sp.]